MNRVTKTLNKLTEAVKNVGTAFVGAKEASRRLSEAAAKTGRRKAWKPAGPKGKRRLPRNNPKATLAKRRAGHHGRSRNHAKVMKTKAGR